MIRVLYSEDSKALRELNAMVYKKSLLEMRIWRCIAFKL